MPCFKTLSINAAASDSFYPLHTAVYVAATDKILGASGNYIVEFNATTGAVIRAVKAIAPMYGPAHICLAGTDPYVAYHSDRSAQSEASPSATHIRNDIFPVDPTTLFIGTGIGVYNKAWVANYGAVVGPRQFLQIGTRIYFLYPVSGEVWIIYMDKTNPAIFNQQHANTGFWSEQISTDGTYIYIPDPAYPEINRRNTALTYSGYADTTGYWPVACEWVPAPISQVHAVCADKWLLRVTSFTTHTAVPTDLEVLIGSVVTGIKPLRLRYRASDLNVYIPVQNKDGIIVYTPGTGTAVWKSGFESPVDVVFTPTKAFAVQSSIIGLKEIT